jgi:hypothetical protein
MLNRHIRHREPTTSIVNGHQSAGSFRERLVLPLCGRNSQTPIRSAGERRYAVAKAGRPRTPTVISSIERTPRPSIPISAQFIRILHTPMKAALNSLRGNARPILCKRPTHLHSCPLRSGRSISSDPPRCRLVAIQRNDFAQARAHGCCSFDRRGTARLYAARIAPAVVGHNFYKAAFH